jgi:hypothetical protein
VSCKKYYALKQTHSEEEPSLAFLELEKERKKPEIFMMWSFPALLQRGVQLDQHIDVIMHLLFL